jgi:hypothetical protein
MARLVSPPAGLPITSIEPLAGPRAVGGGASQSIGNFVQTFASPFNLWRFQFSFAPMKDAAFRRYRGWITSLNGGANATRWEFNDPDIMSFADADVVATDEQLRRGMPWSNGQPWLAPGQDPWFNTGNWSISRPIVPVAAGAAREDTIIRLGPVFWGHSLGVGDDLGFLPFHLGLYTVTEVIAPGTYRIWPDLRKAIGPDDFATLEPSLALRLESESAANAGRGLSSADGLTATFVETLDYDVRDYFAD